MKRSYPYLTLLAAVVMVMGVITPGTVLAENVVWDVNNAIAGGSACNAQGPFPDTWFIAAGEDLSVIFSNMGIDLTPSTAQNTAVHGCLVRIPLTINKRVAVASLTQEVEWGYAKDLNTEARLNVNATLNVAGVNLFPFPNAPVITAFISGTVEGVQPWITASTTSFASHAAPGPFCTGADHTGMLSVNFSLAARRTSTVQDISVRIHGEDIQYNASMVFPQCP